MDVQASVKRLRDFLGLPAALTVTFKLRQDIIDLCAGYEAVNREAERYKNSFTDAMNEAATAIMERNAARGQYADADARIGRLVKRIHELEIANVEKVGTIGRLERDLEASRKRNNEMAVLALNLEKKLYEQNMAKAREAKDAEQQAPPARCPATFGNVQCDCDRGHSGPHYVNTNDISGICWEATTAPTPDALIQPAIVWKATHVEPAGTNLLGDHLCWACDRACDCCQPDECVSCSRCGKAKPQRAQHVATCETNGHVYGHAGVCVFCDAPKSTPVEPAGMTGQVRLCGALHLGTGAVCELPLDHAENHRGSFSRGIAQWPYESVEPAGAACDGGVAVRWCPRCGTCTCPSQESQPNEWVDDPLCPIHGSKSTHVEPAGASEPPSEAANSIVLLISAASAASGYLERLQPDLSTRLWNAVQLVQKHVQSKQGEPAP